MRRGTLATWTALVAAPLMLSGCAITAHGGVLSKPVISGQPAVSTKVTHLKCSHHPIDLIKKHVGSYNLYSDPTGGSLLAPPDATAAVVCHYAGLNVPHVRWGTLLGTTTVPDPGALVAALNKSTRAPDRPPGVPYNCPFDDLTRDQIMFLSPTRGITYIDAPRNGCVAYASSMVTGAWIPTVNALEMLTTLDEGYLPRR